MPHGQQSFVKITRTLNRSEKDSLQSEHRCLMIIHLLRSKGYVG